MNGDAATETSLSTLQGDLYSAIQHILNAPQPVVGVYSHPGAGLREAPLDEDLLADVSQCVGDRTRRDVTPNTIDINFNQIYENVKC